MTLAPWMRKALLAFWGMGMTANTAAADVTDELSNQLKQNLPSIEARFVGHETITTRERAAPKTYLLLDFRYDQMPEEQDLQASIHSICTEVLHNQELISDLSRHGVHMVSVAFDRHHQYDCL